MAQLGELSERHAEFEERDARAVMIGQEDESLDMFWTLVDGLEGDVPFDLATDLHRARTRRYDRITTYLLDANGRVLEIFPVHRRLWMPWDAVLFRIDELD